MSPKKAAFGLFVISTAGRNPGFPQSDVSEISRYARKDMVMRLYGFTDKQKGRL
jgi:hypothetical protein